MSYINDALRKAQKERDSRYRPYEGIISQLPERPPRPSVKWLSAGILSLTAAVGASVLWVALHHPPDPAVGSKGGPDGGTHRTVVPTPPPPDRAGAEAPAAGRDTPSGTAPLNDAANLYGEALTAQRERKAERAERLYKRVLTIDPGHVRTLNNLGVLYMSSHRREQAVPLFEKALAQKKDYADPYYNLACLYAQRGETGKALAYLKSAVAIREEAAEWAKQDGDLKDIRSTEAFKAIMEKKRN